MVEVEKIGRAQLTPDKVKGMQLSDFRLKLFLCLILVGGCLYLDMFNQVEVTVLPASKSSVKSLTPKFHFFSAFSSGLGEVTILLVAHNSVKVESIQLKYENIVSLYFL